MSLALRDSDRELATAVRGRALLWHPERVADPTFKAWRACVDAEIKRLRVRIHNGPLADSMTTRAMTWTRRDVGINDGSGDWREWDNTALCPILTEEGRHVIEIPLWGGRFQGAYVFNPRARWAIEMQATIAIFRWHRAMEARRARVLKIAEARAAAFARPFPGYNLWRIRDLKRETVGLLMDVFDGRVP